LGDGKRIPAFRLLDRVGKPLDGAVLPEVGLPFEYIYLADDLAVISAG